MLLLALKEGTTSENNYQLAVDRLYNLVSKIVHLFFKNILCTQFDIKEESINTKTVVRGALQAVKHFLTIKSSLDIWIIFEGFVSI